MMGERDWDWDFSESCPRSALWANVEAVKDLVSYTQFPALNLHQLIFLPHLASELIIHNFPNQYTRKQKHDDLVKMYNLPQVSR